MKRKLFSAICIVSIIMVAGHSMYIAQDQGIKLADLKLINVEALAQNESGNYSCTVTVDCGLPLTGSISCTGSVCKRGFDWTKGSYVECDGRRTYC